MRFLLDVYVSTRIGRMLTEHGHDVLRASEDQAGWSDSDIFTFAVREDRILVTKDSDFSELIYRDRRPAPLAILYLRCGPAHQSQMADRLLLVLENFDIRGHMVVVQRTNVRHRLLPEKSNDNG